MVSVSILICSISASGVTINHHGIMISQPLLTKTSFQEDIELVEKNLEFSIRHQKGFLDIQLLQPIIDQLGWVYNTSKYVVSLSIKGVTLYRLLSAKYMMFSTWYGSLSSMREEWQLFKASPSISSLIQFVSSVRTLLSSTIPIILDLTDGRWEIILLFQSFLLELRDFLVFLEKKPWSEPIVIEGNVKGLRGGRAIVSCKNDSVTTDGAYSLIYTTIDEPEPWALHECMVTATYKGITKTKEKYAFSMGKLRIDFDFSERSQDNLKT